MSCVEQFVDKCVICQQLKSSNSKPNGLLIPLPIPQGAWQDFSIDFITHLLKIKGKTVIMVVVDKLTKICHLGALPSDFTATMVVKLFVQNIIKLHGFPSTIVSDRDKIFTSKFWKEIHKLSSTTTLCFTSAYHPQGDGQTEIVNKTIEMYLRASVYDCPKKWL